MRVTLYIAAFLSGILLPFPVFVAFVAVYAFVYSSFELLVIAILIDAYYGEAGLGHIWYLYTLSVALVAVVSEGLKPHLTIYDNQDV